MGRDQGIIARYEEGIKKGLGVGRQSAYQPWMTVWNTKSWANRSHMWSPRLRRTVHFLSHGEYLAFLQFDWMKNVVDIREQFPLDPEETLKICGEMKVLHPGYSRGGHVMTTDFVVTYDTPSGLRDHAYQIKCSQADLENKRTYTKLLIEREYWKRQGVPWTLLLSSDFNKIRTHNLDRLVALRFEAFSEEDFARLLKAFIGWQSMYPDRVPCELPLAFVPASRERSISSEQAVLILAAHQRIKFAIDEVRIEQCPLGEFLLAEAFHAA